VICSTARSRAYALHISLKLSAAADHTDGLILDWITAEPRQNRGQCPVAALFGGAALLVKRRNSKWSFRNEPEVRFRF